MRHIGTGMLLCSYEIHRLSCTSGHWTGYLAGVKTVINAAPMEVIAQTDPDVVALLDWVRYYDSLARFSLAHWTREGAPDVPKDPICLRVKVCCDSTSYSTLMSRGSNARVNQLAKLPPTLCSMAMLMSQVMQAAPLDPMLSKEADHSKNHKKFIEILDWRIRNLPIPCVGHDTSESPTTETLVLKLYKLSLLIYLNRISEEVLGQSIRMQQYVAEAFAIASKLEFCVKQFPVWIVGCEAQTDEQRAAILDLVARTEKLASSRSFHYCVSLLQALWVQDDLAHGNGISYWRKMTSVMNVCRIPPAFV